jgi:hypothetical protein
VYQCRRGDLPRQRVVPGSGDGLAGGSEYDALDGAGMGLGPTRPRRPAGVLDRDSMFHLAKLRKSAQLTGEYAANSGRPAHRCRSLNVCQRSVKPSASPAPRRLSRRTPSCAVSMCACGALVGRQESRSILADRCSALGVLSVLVGHFCVAKPVCIGTQLHSKIARHERNRSAGRAL